MQVDPIEPPKFLHKKVMGVPPDDPVPIMHSPPRKLTKEDVENWTIPAAISNWKNKRGFTIPLDKRLATDGRGLIEHVVNDKFAKFATALYTTERNARDQVSKRAELENALKLKEKDKKEEMLRKMAQEARVERGGERGQEEEEEEQDQNMAVEKPYRQNRQNEQDEEETARMEREQIREQRRKERERDLRIQRNKSSSMRDGERDVSEKVALGMAVSQKKGEVQYDQRLFNQTGGLDSGFGDDEDDNVYTKPLFQSNFQQIYRPKTNENENFGSEKDLEKLKDTSKFKPDKGFSGTEKDNDAPKTARSGPVEFEKDDDVYGLNSFLSEAKKSSKPLDHIGKQGTMHAASSSQHSTGGSAKRKIEFDSSKQKKSKHE